MSLFDDNLAVLKARFPVAARRIMDAAGPSEAGAGKLTQEESARVASLWLGERKWRAGAFLAVSGWGDGGHVKALLERLHSGARAFIAESSPAVLRASLEAEDWRAIFADDRVYLGAGEVDEAFFSAMNALDVLAIRDVDPVVFAPLYNCDPQYYAGFFTEFARQVDFRRKLYGTAVVDAELWFANSVDNLRSVICAPDVKVLQGAFKDVPMVLVSAGPSLDESMDFLREVQHCAVVVAVNSSYRALRHAGVVPHLVLAADPRGHTLLGFEGVSTDRTWLVTTPIVAPTVPRRFESRVLGWSGNNSLATELRRRCGLPPGTALIEQGTVSACAVDLAVLMGCVRLCLVGQDLAVSPDGRSHAADSFYTDLDINRVDPGKCRRLPGNTLEQVLVEEKLYVYLKTFEALAAARSEVRMINTARLGAKIRGVPYASLKDARTWIGAATGLDIFAEIDRRCGGPSARDLTVEQALAALQPTCEYARRLIEKALAVVRELEPFFTGPAADATLRDGDMPRPGPGVRALRAALESEVAEFAILESGRFRLESHRMREFIGGLDQDVDPSERELREAREFAWAVAEGAWFLFSRLSRASMSQPSRLDVDTR